MKDKKIIVYCPTCAIDCPYCIGLDYECIIDNPEQECDDYIYYHGEDDEE